MADKKAPSGRKDTSGSADKAKTSARLDDKTATSRAQGTSRSQVATSKAGVKGGGAKPASSKGSAAKPTTAKSTAAKSTTTQSTTPKSSTTKPSGPEAAGKTDSAAASGEAKTAIPASGATAPPSKGAGDTVSSTDEPGTTPPSSKAAEGVSADTRTAESKPASARPASSTPAASAPRRGGFFPLLLGGVCAAAIGFAAAYYLFPQLGVMTPDTEGTSTQLEEQTARIDALDARIAEIPAAPDTSGLESGQRDMAERLAGLTEQLNTLSARLDAVEAQPTGAEGEGVTTGELSALRQTLDSQGEQIDALTAELQNRDEAASAAAQQDLRRAAVTRIASALENGSPFATALGNLVRAGMSAPDALQNLAEDGVPTKAALQDSFAPAARAALDRARKSGEATEGDGGFWSFMSDQLGVRSLERREGSGTDAILSRAEDDLQNGKLESALGEVETLPDPARSEMSGWMADARARMQALAAQDALAAKLN